MDVKQIHIKNIILEIKLQIKQFLTQYWNLPSYKNIMISINLIETFATSLI